MLPLELGGFFPHAKGYGDMCGVVNTPRGGVVNYAQVKILGIPFCSQRTLGAHPSPLGIGVLSSSWGVAPWVARLVLTGMGV